MIQESSILLVKKVKPFEVIKHYVDLKKHGSNYLGKCPFHEENTPSFSVSANKNLYKCFGCGVSGDAIKFIMDYEKKSFIESVELIAGISGIILEKDIKRTDRTFEKGIKRPGAKQNHLASDTIPLDIFLKGYPKGIQDISRNPLARKLAEIFSESIILEVLDRYQVSLTGAWITYPQFDINGQYRTAKSIKFDNSGHRDAQAYPKWAHRELIKRGQLPENFKLKQCFTGEHLISHDRDKTIAIVEGQSTMLFMAALASAAIKHKIEGLQHFNDFIYISTGGVDGIGWKDKNVLGALRNRQVILFPDAGFYYKWSMDAEIMAEYGIKVTVSDLLENLYETGLLQRNDDLRDYFMMYDHEIRTSCNPSQILISTKDILPANSILKTGEDFGGLISSTFYLRDDRIIDILFDQNEIIVIESPFIQPFEEFYKKRFVPGKINNIHCLINTVTY